MRLIFKVLIAFSALSLIFGAASEKYSEVFARSSSGATYLVLGLDDASQNADVIFTVSTLGDASSLSVIQIPRDTYCSFEGEDVKINSVFARYLAKGLSEKDALSAATDYIGRHLGVGISGYAAIGTDAFTDIIDEIGGVALDIPEGFSLLEDENYEYNLKAGENLLSGKEALYFVRYRKGYERGDLERIDTQKIFLRGILETLTERVGITRAISIADDVFSGVVSNIPLREIISLMRNVLRCNSSAITLITLPGEAVCYDGSVWYYVLNKVGTEAVLGEYLPSYTGEFDPSRVFTKNDSQIDNIYNKDK